jgi:hypothetical protein
MLVTSNDTLLMKVHGVIISRSDQQRLAVASNTKCVHLYDFALIPDEESSRTCVAIRIYMESKWPQSKVAGTYRCISVSIIPKVSIVKATNDHESMDCRSTYIE